jgi:hypothetical protein
MHFHNQAKYDEEPNGLGTNLTGMLSSIRSKMSSLASSFVGSVRESTAQSSFEAQPGPVPARRPPWRAPHTVPDTDQQSGFVPPVRLVIGTGKPVAEAGEDSQPVLELHQLLRSAQPEQVGTTFNDRKLHEAESADLLVSKRSLQVAAGPDLSSIPHSHVESGDSVQPLTQQLAQMAAPSAHERYWDSGNIVQWLEAGQSNAVEGDAPVSTKDERSSKKLVPGAPCRQVDFVNEKLRDTVEDGDVQSVASIDSVCAQGAGSLRSHAAASELEGQGTQNQGSAASVDGKGSQFASLRPEDDFRRRQAQRNGAIMIEGESPLT